MVVVYNITVKILTNIILLFNELIRNLNIQIVDYSKPIYSYLLISKSQECNRYSFLKKNN